MMKLVLFVGDDHFNTFMRHQKFSLGWEFVNSFHLRVASLGKSYSE